MIKSVSMQVDATVYFEEGKPARVVLTPPDAEFVFAGETDTEIFESHDDMWPDEIADFFKYDPADPMRDSNAIMAAPLSWSESK